MTDEKFDENGYGKDPRVASVRASVIKLAGGDDAANPLVGDVSRAIQNVEEDEQFFQEKGAVEPPYDPRILNLLFEHSNALRQNVDAYATNIDGFGHAFSAVVDLEADSTRDDVRALIVIEQFGEDGKIDPNAKEPGDAEVDKRIKQLANEQRAESLRLASFFDDCSDISFADLRRQTRQDIEITGNGYWEVVRDRTGRIARFHQLESFTVRLTKLDRELTEYKVKRRTLTQEFEEVTRRRRFRRFLQRVGRDAVYFKEFGDPRIISTQSGKAYETNALMVKDEPGASEATEVMHFRVPSSRSAYGIPRWIGNLLSVLGSRQSEEVNFNYFENKSVPPLAVLVSGGRLTKDSVGKLENFIKDNIRGKANFHKILVIEAEGDSSSAFENSGRMKVELKPLTEAQAQEGLFQGYDERNIDKVGMSFRLPRMLRGDTRDFNRSCYSEDTETLTEAGWKTYDQIGPKEKVAAFDKETGEVVFVVPKDKLVYEVENELMVHFESAHVDCLVTSNHRMLLRSAQTRKAEPPWEVFEADSIPYNRFEFQQAAHVWAGAREISMFELPKEELCRIERGHNHVDVIDGDDWLEFIGYFVSEGCVVDTQHPSAPYLVALDQKKPVTRDKMRACLDRLGWKYSEQVKKACGTTHFLFSNRCLRAWLVENCGTHASTKRLPEGYAGLSARQLRILLDALMAGDGTVDQRIDRTNRTYYTTSAVLMGQVQQILTLLGYRNVGYWSPGASCYRVNFSDHVITRLNAVDQAHAASNVSRERYTGVVYCFSVPKYGFFVTRRNGRIAIQGNTAMAALDFAERQVFEPERQSFDYRMNRDILPALNVKRWRMKSNGPTQRDPESLAKMIHDLQDFMTPNIMLELSQQVFNRNFARINAPWGDQPLKMTLATMSAKPASETPETEDTDPDNQAPNNEPDAPGDDGQGRTSDGRFGADGKPNGQPGGKKKPPKVRATASRKREYTLDDDDLDEVADALLGARDRLTEVVSKRLAARSMAKRVEDPAGGAP